MRWMDFIALGRRVDATGENVRRSVRIRWDNAREQPNLLSEQIKERAMAETAAGAPTSIFAPMPINDIEGFRIGHWTDLDAATGCTAIVAPAGAAGGVDVRGGAPASRETDLLRPENTVDAVHAVVLSGGSAFGLEAASGAARELEARGIGLPTGPAKVPIVCSSCIFDLAFGRSDVRPDIEAGAAAVRAALDGDAATPVAEGSVGAGTGATVGKALGPDCAMKGGLGARALAFGPLQVGAVVAVNACGNVVDPATGTAVAGMRTAADDTQIIAMEQAIAQMTAAGAAGAGADATGTAGAAAPDARTNTTIACVITNAKLTKAQATKVAQMAADAYAHVIHPTHTTNDGDTIYVLASGALGEASAAIPLDIVGMLATRALEEAIVAGCTQAESLHGLPAYRDLQK